MFAGGVTLFEFTATLYNHIDRHFTPGQAQRVFLGQHLDETTIDHDASLAKGDLRVKTAIVRVILE